MVDYNIVNVSPVGFIAVGYIIKHPINKYKLTFKMQEAAPL